MAKNTNEKPKEEKEKDPCYRCVEVQQQVAFGFTIDFVKSVIKQHEDIILSYCFILHNKDVYKITDEAEDPNHKEGTHKADHIHAFFKFKSPTHQSTICKMFNVQPQQIERMKAPTYAKMVEYAIHKNDPTKYQYDPKEVIANFNYTRLVLTEKRKIKPEQRKEEIAEMIMNGTLRKYNLLRQDIPFPISNIEFSRYKSFIETQLEARMLLLRQQQRHQEVFFIQGPSGSGKTSFARQWCKNNGLSFKESDGGKHPLDGYEGQDVLILDDLRGSTMSFADLLKLIDNYQENSEAEARYHNKFMECQYIFITTTQDINSFYNNLFKDSEEDIIQLKRRCGTFMKISDDLRTIDIWFWSDDLRDYIKQKSIKNPVFDLLKNRPVQNMDEKFSSFFGNYETVEEKENEPTSANVDPEQLDLSMFFTN